MKKLKKQIMKELDLDRWSHDIKIIYRSSHAIFSDRIVFTPIEIKGDKHVRIMFDRIDSTPQLKAVELYISVEPRTKLGGEDVQQTILEGGRREELQLLHADEHNSEHIAEPATHLHPEAMVVQFRSTSAFI